MRCAALLLFGILCLAVTCLRSGEMPEIADRRVMFHPLRAAAGAVLAPGLSVESAWRLTSRHAWFGGYSALWADRSGLFTAVTDSGARLDFTDPSAGPPQASLGKVFRDLRGPKELRDAEAMTRDPATGRFWIAYEYRNAIQRYDRGMAPEGGVAPRAMRRWPSNGGAEAMTRLADGRFILVSEAARPRFGEGAAALLFPGDPLDGAPPLPFSLVLPDGYTASDMAALPDGRVLILARRLTFPFPPRFAIRLMMADPADIRAGRPWPWRELARLGPPAPIDNYEGVAVVPRADGGVTIWLISDDNLMATQRTLLLKLRWTGAAPAQKGAGTGPAPLRQP